MILLLPNAIEFLRARRFLNSKIFEIRSFFFEKWLLSHIFAGRNIMLFFMRA